MREAERHEVQAFPGRCVHTDDVGIVFVLSRRALAFPLAPAKLPDDIRCFDPFTERLFRVWTGKTIRMRIVFRRCALLGETTANP